MSGGVAPSVGTVYNGFIWSGTAWVIALPTGGVTGGAPVDSPAFTGDPQAPTPPLGDNDRSIATTEFVTRAMAGLPIGDLDCGIFPNTVPPPIDPPPGTPGAYPDASNTGTSGTLTANATAELYTGFDGQVIQNQNFNDCRIYVQHRNVVIRNCRIRTTDLFCIDNTSDSLTVEDCELIGTASTSQPLTSYGEFLIIRRCEITGGQDGIFFRGSATITDNWIHTIGGGPDSHCDTIQTDKCGPNPTLIQHNTLEGRDNGHVFLQCTLGNLINIKVLDNKLVKDPTYGPPNYNIWINGWSTPDNPAITISNVEVAFNFGDRGLYGDIDVDGRTSGISVHDNTIGFTVEPPPATAGVTLYGGAAPTGGTPTMDNNQMSLGCRVDPLVNGTIAAVLYYRASTIAAADGKVALYNAAGTKLGEAAFTGHTGVGWKRVAFTAPIAVVSTSAYVAAVWYKTGTDGHSWYWAHANRFTTAGVTATGKITAPVSDGTTSRGAVQKNNVFTYAAPTDIAFPDQVYNGASYYIDVDFVG